MKKFAMILMCVALVFACCVPAFAVDSYTITIDNAILKETYKAYKIFDVSYSGDSYSYSITPASEWWTAVTTPASGNTVIGPDGTTGVTITQPSDLLALSKFTVDGLTFTKSANTDGSGNVIYNVAPQGTLSAAQTKALADKLYPNTTGKTVAGQVTPTTSNPTASIDVTTSGPGYYFVTTSVGAFCALDTTDTTARVEEKNSVPSIEKKVSDTGSAGTWADTADAAFGDTVYFQITVTDGKGTDKALVVSDTMPHGLVINTNTMTVGENTVTTPNITIQKKTTVSGSTTTTTVDASASTYTMTVDNDLTGFEITFAPAFINSLAENDEIIILYNATVQNDAYVRGNELDVTDPQNPTEAFNKNYVTLVYSEQESTDDVTVYTYKFQVVKTDSSDEYLEGAKFKLYAPGANNTTVEVPVVKLPAEVQGERINRYRFATAAEIANDQAVLIDAGLFEIVGVDAGVAYSLEEVEAPTGYNLLTDRETVTVAANNYAAQIVQFDTTNTDLYSRGGTQIVNYTGAELPSTGGIGTYLFYGIGAVLVIGAVVVLVSKKRMRAVED